MTLLQHREYGTFKTVPVPPEAGSLDDIVKPMGFDDALVTVWEDGRIVNDQTFAQIRARADAARL
jgi:nicotinamide phosphoribosyltransferase